MLQAGHRAQGYAGFLGQLFLCQTRACPQFLQSARYSRARALADGVLIEVGTMAREAGIRFPVALTRAVWERCVRVPPGVICQDEVGRLWNLLWLLRLAIAHSDGGPQVRFAVHVHNHNGPGTPPLMRLRAVCGPGDDGEPVITVMEPDED